MSGIPGDASRVVVRFETVARGVGATPLVSCPSIGRFAYVAEGAAGDEDLVVEIGGSASEHFKHRVKVQDAEISWSPGCAYLRCPPALAETLLPGLAHFALEEAETRRLEAEVFAAWSELEEDRPLVFEATTADLKRSGVLAKRVSAVFGRRIRFARLESCTLTETSELTPLAAKLADKLGDAADVEARLEVLDSQLEVFEHVYEMASQRVGEFSASHQGHRVEWIIIVLLALEILITLLGDWGKGLLP